MILCNDALRSCSVQVALRKCCQTAGMYSRVLPLYLKVAILQPEMWRCAPRTAFVLTSCDFAAGAAGAYVLTSCDV